MSLPSSADVVLLASAPILMVVVSLFERRWGPLVGGMVAAAPVTALIGLLLVSSSLGPAVSVQMAVTMSGYAPAQVGLAIAVIVGVPRIGLVAGFAVGTVVFASLAWLSVQTPTPVAVIVSVVTLGVALRLLHGVGPSQDVNPPAMSGGWWMIGLRAAVSLLTAVGLLAIANRFGAAAGGAVGAYPIFTVTLCAFVFASAGATGVQQVLLGMVRGLPAYLVFVLIYGLAASQFGVAVGCMVAAITCSTCYLLPSLRVKSEPSSEQQSSGALIGN